MAKMSATLKLGGGKPNIAYKSFACHISTISPLLSKSRPSAEPILPGLALPEAFESLDKRIESTVQFCSLKGSVESQILGLVTVCQEMQRLLKFAFIGKLL